MKTVETVEYLKLFINTSINRGVNERETSIFNRFNGFANKKVNLGFKI